MNRANVLSAIEKGKQYLLSLQQNGYWQGFPTLAGQSDIWVTGFVTAHLKLFSVNEEWLTKAQRFLLASRHNSGGWSYSHLVPPDADSTSWCLMALEGYNGFTSAMQNESKVFLWKHFENNGFSTYHTGSGIHTFIGVPDISVVAGWTLPHSDVTAAALLADAHHKLIGQIAEELFQSQSKEGLLPAYWWRSKFYTLVILLRVFKRIKKSVSGSYGQLLRQTLLNNQSESGFFSLDTVNEYNSFETALALELFTHLSTDVADLHFMKCTDALLDKQKENGCWQGDDLLRIPLPYIHNPDTVTDWNRNSGGGNSYVEDKNGLFTTAISCYALHTLLTL